MTDFDIIGFHSVTIPDLRSPEFGVDILS